MRFFTEWGRACLDLLFPPEPPPDAPKCIVCKQIGDLLCPACAQLVEPLPEQICARCGRPVEDGCSIWCDNPDPPLQMVRAAASYHIAPTRQLIHHLKYYQKPELAPYLAKYLVAVFDRPCWVDIRDTITAVVPIPGDKKREEKRGYNQAELLASSFSNTINLPLYVELLEKIETSESQTNLSFSERAKNVEGKYVASPSIAEHYVLLIDDVSTSGATMAACARAALSAGAICVYGLSIAMPLHGHD
ncbi:MAG: double zinc ribbon domain-containing protein [Chloroflexota bacterium]